jgi:hypothetical protein
LAIKISLIRPLQGDVVECVWREGEQAERPALLNGEVDHRAMDAVAPEKRVNVGKVIEDQKAARLDLRGRSASIPHGSFIGMVRVDVDPIEIPIGKCCELLVRPSAVREDACVPQPGIGQARKIDIDEMQLLGLTSGLDFEGKVATLGTELGDATAAR